MNLIKFSSLVFLALALAACGQKGPKMPDCSSPEAAKFVTSYVADQIIGDGANDERAQDLIKRLTVTDIKTAPQSSSGSTGTRCNANVAIAYPGDFGGKIFAIFTTPSLMNGLKDHLGIKYGAFYGPATYKQLHKLFNANINQVETTTLNNEQVREIANKTLQKNIDTVLTIDNKIDVTYTISPAEGSGENTAISVKSQINDIENYDQNVLVLKLLGNLQ